MVSWTMDVGAITIYPFIVCRDKEDKRMLNHEAIHIHQQKELLIVPFFLIYLLNWAFNLFKYKDMAAAYRNIVFEREAYGNEDNFKYLDTRERFAWRKLND